MRSIETSLHIISERLYSIGLSLFRVSNEKRPKIYNPIVVSIVLFLSMGREIVSYLMDNPRLSMTIQLETQTTVELNADCSHCYLFE